MAKGAYKEGGVLHFGSVRFRLKGSGVLRSELRSLDDVVTAALPNIQMAAATAKEPTILSHMNQQRAYLHFETTDIDEILNISKIVIFVRPVFTGLPTESAPA